SVGSRCSNNNTNARHCGQTICKRPLGEKFSYDHDWSAKACTSLGVIRFGTRRSLQTSVGEGTGFPLYHLEGAMYRASDPLSLWQSVPNTQAPLYLQRP